MKKRILLFVASLLCMASAAQGTRWVEASALNLIGRPFPDTPNPYHRVDTQRFPGFNPAETRQLHGPSGMAVLFRTDSRRIDVAADWGYTLWARSIAGPVRKILKKYDIK